MGGNHQGSDFKKTFFAEIQADQNGVFTYAVPHAGWWGFAALNTAAEKMMHDGKPKDVEMGAVIWIKFHPWKQ